MKGAYSSFAIIQGNVLHTQKDKKALYDISGK
jgi:hypothetical protein